MFLDKARKTLDYNFLLWKFDTSKLDHRNLQRLDFNNTKEPEQEVELLFSLGPESIVQRKNCEKKASSHRSFIGRLGRFCMQLGMMVGGVFALEESSSPEQVVVEKLGPWVPLLIDSGSSTDACPRAFGTNYAQIRQQQPVHKVLKNASQFVFVLLLLFIAQILLGLRSI